MVCQCITCSKTQQKLNGKNKKSNTKMSERQNHCHNTNQINISKTFCILPWMHLATTSTGNIRVCCNSTPGKNLVRDANGKPYNIKNTNASEFWHSEFLQNIREQMLKGQHVEICERCYNEEKSGIKSARQSWNERWLTSLTPADLQSRTPQPNIKYIDLRLGNLCNLRCVMCNPYSSDQWTKHWNGFAPLTKPLSDEEIQRLQSLNWFQKHTVWQNIVKYANSIEEMYLTGGEPTLAVAQYALFDELIQLGVAGNISLKLNTNLTNIPQKMKHYWHHFKKIKINASIDGYGPINNYIRFPSKWKKIEQNLFEFKNLACEHSSKYQLQIHTTVQMHNILKLDELFDFLIAHNCNDIFLNLLNHPKYLNIRCLPPSLKAVATAKLQPYATQIPKISGLIHYMNSQHWSDQMRNFLQFTEILDHTRNTCFFDLVPELKTAAAQI